MMKEETHVFQGMRRDNHQIRQDGKFLWDAHNIRLTNRNDSTFLSITNEKGTSDSLLTFEGYYVGHCVLGKYLVVFTANKDGSNNYIYRVEKTDSGYINIILFHEPTKWEHCWSPENPIEAIGVYETELVQKIYWVDGVNQPRVINITKPELKLPKYIDNGNQLLLIDGVNLSGPSPNFSTNPSIDQYLDTHYPKGFYLRDSFDFVRELQLKEWVDVTKIYGQGEFSPGTIQYALSYYDKYGQESNIFHITPIYYISYSDRGGSPEDKIANSFKLEIGAFDDRFDYIRIYSIHRTSIDATPTVKVVGDVEPKYPVDETGQKDKGGHITFTDTGNIGYTIDPNQLLYIGGTSLVASTITSKDGTLFLGNISLKLNHFKEYEGILKGELFREGLYDSPSYPIENGLYYSYNNVLDNYRAGFKTNESYRCGVQIQNGDGRWSDPIFIEDRVLCQEYPWVSGSKRKQMELLISKEKVNSLIDAGAKRIRSCVVFPSPGEYEVICQGVLCPTVFNVGMRKRESPYSISSWFFRPATKKIPETENIKSTYIGFIHNKALYAAAPDSSINLGIEIQNMPDDYTIANNDQDSSKFFIDENIVTLHSPDIEFTNTIDSLDLSGTTLRIVGIANLGAISGDIDVQTSSPTINPSAEGFVHATMGYTLGSDNMSNGGLVSGPFFKDNLVKSDYKKGDLNYIWPIYTWQRLGSLNNDVTSTGKDRTQSAVLSKKKISNLKFFSHNSSIKVGESVTTIDMNIGKPEIFSSSELSVSKVAINHLGTTRTYFGNVDSLVTSDKSYNLLTITGNKFSDITNNDAIGYNSDTKNIQVNNPVRIKYKSTPHIVFSLGGPGTNISLLPRHEDATGKFTDSDREFTYPSWSSPAGIVEKSYNYVLSLYSNEAFQAPPINNSISEGYCHVGRVRNSAHLCVTVAIKENNKIVFTTLSPGDGLETIILKATKGATSIKNRSNYLPGTSSSDYNGSRYIGEDRYYKVKFVDSTKDSTDCDLELIDNSSQQLQRLSANETFYLSQELFTDDSDGRNFRPYLLIGELYKPVLNKFGGNPNDAKTQNLWFPSSKPIVLSSSEDAIVPFEYGDTWYSRYDCLKTYPFTQEDENQVVEIGSFMCETRVNIDGRYDRNRGQLSNLNMTPQNFNLINEVYSQKDNFFNYRILDEDYYKQDTFANQITWSKEKHAGEEVDTWTNITLANTLDMSGNRGGVNALKAWNEYLLCFQDKALSQILFNSRAQIPVSDGIPIEISNGYKVDSSRLLSGNIGCSNKWSIVDTSSGVYFLDSNTDSIYLFNGQITNLSKDRGMDWWARSIADNKIWKPISSPNNGIRTFHDSKYGDVYFTPGPVTNIQGDALCYSEHIGQFTSFMSYGGTQAMFNYADGFYSIRNSYNQNTTKLYLNNAGKYNDFYGNFKGWDFSFISNQDPTSTKVFDTIELRTDHYNIKNLSRTPLDSCPMNYIQVSNEYQDSGNVPLDNINMRKKFRVWRGLLPRHAGTRERIRNPWAMVTLGWAPDPREEASKLGINERRAVIHDVAVKYTV